MPSDENIMCHYYERFVIQIQRQYHVTTREYIKLMFTGMIQVVIVSYLFYENIFAAIVLCPYIHFYIVQKSHEIYEQKKKNTCLKFKDGMLAISFALNVGYSMENAFKEAISELTLLHGADSDITKQFSNMVRRVQRNENIEDVLQDYADMSEIEDIKYFTEVFRYAKRSGGDMISIIRNTARIISEKAEVYNEIQTVISGKKMEQKVMSLVPFGIILYLKITAPEFIQPLYGNELGIIVMTICLLVYIISDYIAKRIITIEV